MVVQTGVMCRPPCQNGGTCDTSNGTCRCPAGYGGSDCSGKMVCQCFLEFAVLNIWTHFKNSWKLARYSALDFDLARCLLESRQNGYEVRPTLVKVVSCYIGSLSQTLERKSG